MIFIENGYVQDGLKAIVYLIPLLYLIVKRKKLHLKYIWLFFIGLSLLFFGNLLDFIDEFEFLRELNIAERYKLIHDFLEDIIGFTLGFGIFIFALYMELNGYQKASSMKGGR